MSPGTAQWFERFSDLIGNRTVDDSDIVGRTFANEIQAQSPDGSRMTVRADPQRELQGIGALLKDIMTGASQGAQGAPITTDPQSSSLSASQMMDSLPQGPTPDYGRMGPPPAPVPNARNARNALRGPAITSEFLRENTFRDPFPGASRDANRIVNQLQFLADRGPSGSRGQTFLEAGDNEVLNQAFDQAMQGNYPNEGGMVGGLRAGTANLFQDLGRLVLPHKGGPDAPALGFGGPNGRSNIFTGVNQERLQNYQNIVQRLSDHSGGSVENFRNMLGIQMELSSANMQAMQTYGIQDAREIRDHPDAWPFLVQNVRQRMAAAGLTSAVDDALETWAQNPSNQLGVFLGHQVAEMNLTGNVQEAQAMVTPVEQQPELIEQQQEDSDVFTAFSGQALNMARIAFTGLMAQGNAAPAGIPTQQLQEQTNAWAEISQDAFNRHLSNAQMVADRINAQAQGRADNADRVANRREAMADDATGLAQGNFDRLRISQNSRRQREFESIMAIHQQQFDASQRMLEDLNDWTREINSRNRNSPVRAFFTGTGARDAETEAWAQSVQTILTMQTNAMAGIDSTLSNYVQASASVMQSEMTEQGAISNRHMTSLDKIGEDLATDSDDAFWSAQTANEALYGDVASTFAERENERLNEYENAQQRRNTEQERRDNERWNWAEGARQTIGALYQASAASDIAHEQAMRESDQRIERMVRSGINRSQAVAIERRRALGNAVSELTGAPAPAQPSWEFGDFYETGSLETFNEVTGNYLSGATWALQHPLHSVSDPNFDRQMHNPNLITDLMTHLNSRVLTDDVSRGYFATQMWENAAQIGGTIGIDFPDASDGIERIKSARSLAEVSRWIRNSDREGMVRQLIEQALVREGRDYELLGSDEQVELVVDQLVQDYYDKMAFHSIMNAIHQSALETTVPASARARASDAIGNVEMHNSNNGFGSLFHRGEWDSILVGDDLEQESLFPEGQERRPEMAASRFVE